MGQKDIAEKMLAEHADVFADIINVLLFKGKRLVQPEELSPATVRSGYKADNRVLHEMERDVAKYWKQGRICIALFGLENQTEPEAYFPLRVMGYDGQNYRSQLLAINNKNKTLTKAYPVVTLVLYFGTKKWNKHRRLLECFQVSDELKPYVNDYKVNIAEIAFLSEEEVNLFQSDFKIVADYFVQVRKNKNYRPSPQVIKHVDEFLKLMSVLTGDERFENIPFLSEGGAVTMCEVLDKVEKRGREQGRKLGCELGLDSLVKTLLRFVHDFDEVYEAVTANEVYSSVTREEVMKYYKKYQSL